jgi:predicted ATPase/class 3 adenylate cyclase
MLLYAWSDQRPAALRQYQECVRILESQLGVSPQASTAELHKAIAAGRVPQPPVQPSEERKAEIPPRLEPLKLPGDERSPIPEPVMVLADEAKRLVTVLLMDVSRSFTGESDIGPEDEASLVDRFLGAMHGTVAKYGGQIERTLGGSILAIFGAARTHESDPELAIRAAIEARQEAGKLGLRLVAGIGTGEVYLKVAGPGPGQAHTLVGRAIDRAVRLAAQAQVGQILVGESTYRLTRRAFAFMPLSLAGWGADEPVRIYQVERLLPQPKKARGIEGLRAELIGRDKELGKLKGALARALQGQGQMVTLVGEAGVGKSRLVAELSQAALTPDVDGPPPLWLEGRCLELGTAASYAPFLDILRQYFAWGAREASRRRYERVASSLRGMVEQGDLVPERAEEMIALLGHLLSLPVGGAWGEWLENEDPEQIRWQTFLAVRDFFIALCRGRPVVLVFEDLHWADSLSIDLISLLMERLPVVPLLLLCAYRPEREHRCWHLATIAAQKCRGRYTELRLRELGPEQSRQMVESLLRIEDPPSPVKELILARSQGNPFFIEEVVRSLIEAGVVYREGDVWRAQEDVGFVTIPKSVQSVTLSRVDHLEEGWKHALQVASVIGRVFRRRVLERAVQQDADLEQALWELEDRALIYQERTVPEVEYSFKHVLTQETVSFHQRVAEAIEALYQDNPDEYYEQLAHHYERSGNVQEAITYLLKAGEKATRSYANEEAVAHLTRGLELLKIVPQMPERARRELDLQVALGIPLYYIQGQSAAQVGRVYQRALELCEQVDDVQHQFRALIGLRRFYFIRGELQIAHELAERILALAQRACDPFLLSFSQLAMGATLYWLGEFSHSRAYCEQEMMPVGSQRRRSQVFLYGIDIGVGAQLYTALALWHLGYPDQSLQMSQRALVQARVLAHPMTLVYAHHLAGILHQFRREAQVVQELAEEMLRISKERGYAFYSTAGMTLRGWALAELGQEEEGIGQIREGIAAWQAVEASVMLPYSLAFLAEAYEKAGRVQEGRDALTEALATADRTGCRTWEAELYRLEGELLLRKGEEESEAEACFQSAVNLASRQRARSWELRAATSLSRLWHRQGRRDEARELLQAIYGCFSQGFDTADLKEAKALLDALA